MNSSHNLAFADLFCEDRQSLLLSELRGFWLEDSWSKSDLSKLMKVGRGYFHYKFETPHEHINNELKYALYRLFIDGELLPNEKSRADLKIICNYLSNAAEIDTIVRDSLSKHFFRLRDYLNSLGKKSYNTTRSKNGTKFVSLHGSIQLFSRLYMEVYNYYDPRDLLDRPTIDLNKVCSKGSKSRHNIIKLNLIKQDWLREPFREYIKLRCVTIAPGTLYSQYIHFLRFSRFLTKNYPPIKADQVDRDLLLEYLGFILRAVKNGQLVQDTASNNISALRTIMAYLRREGHDFLADCASYTSDDIPSRARGWQARYMPEHIVAQMMKHLSSLDGVYKLILALQLESGARISEIMSLPLDCLKVDVDGDYWLKRFVWKQSKWHSVPLAIEVVALIKEWGNVVRAGYSQHTTLLFPNKTGKKHLTVDGYVNAINEWIRENDIRDEDGLLWKFKTHDCRHTVATRMIDEGLAHHFVCDFLGHDSPEMTKVYAAIKEAKSREVADSFHESRREATGAKQFEDFMVKDVSVAKTVRKNMIAQRLPNGSCNLPVQTASCISGSACLGCDDFETSPEFLPVFRSELSDELEILHVAEEMGHERQIEITREKVALLQAKIAELEHEAGSQQRTAE